MAVAADRTYRRALVDSRRRVRIDDRNLDRLLADSTVDTAANSTFPVDVVGTVHSR